MQDASICSPGLVTLMIWLSGNLLILRICNLFLFSAPTAAELESTWEAISPRLSQFLCGAEELPDDVIPFDAASAVGVEDQKTQVSLLH